MLARIKQYPLNFLFAVIRHLCSFAYGHSGRVASGHFPDTARRASLAAGNNLGIHFRSCGGFGLQLSLSFGGSLGGSLSSASRENRIVELLSFTSSFSVKASASRQDSTAANSAIPVSIRGKVFMCWDCLRLIIPAGFS